MTKLLEEAFDVARKMPPAAQDAIARFMLNEITAEDLEPEDLSPDDLSAVLEGEAQIARGEFIEGEPAEVVAASFDRHRPS